MSPEPPLLLALDLTGTFVFGLNGALTGVRVARLDIVGVLALAVITALGGGITRDVLIGAIPPAAFEDWRYLALALGGGLAAFALSRWLERLQAPIVVLDAVGLSVFAVIGTAKALEFGMGVGPAVLLGGITAVGGGTIRDVLIRQIPSVLHSELYAIPALIAAGLTAAAVSLRIYALPAALGAAAICFAVRMVGVRFRLNAPGPPGDGHHDDHDAPDQPDDGPDDGR